MLVVISDLHLVDKTAGDHNVSGKAYKMWSEEIIALAIEQKVKKIDFLYLGDIIDLIRTEYWLNVPLAERPWGDPAVNEDPGTISDASKKHTLAILDKIEKETQEQLGVLSGRGWDKEQKDQLHKAGITVRRAYIPGNHDRPYCVIPEVKAKVDALLGVTGFLPGQSLHLLASPEYGVVARHGHEFDVWNYEGYAANHQYQFSDTDYQKVPIGDPITTEVAAKVPGAVRKNLLAAGFSQADADRIYVHLQDIENVRPLHAAFQWVYYQADQLGQGTSWTPAQNERATAIVREALTQIFEEFMDLPFVKAWIKKHDAWTTWPDEADKLQLIQGALRFKVPFKVIEFFAKFMVEGDSEQRTGAIGEPLLQDPATNLHYAVYGHTHQYDQLALQVLNGYEKIYFNSGTWRPRLHRAANKKDFVEWKEMTYLVFYGPDEDYVQGNKAVVKGFSFETWTGTMLKRKR